MAATHDIHQQLIVVVSGGGPVGLTFALHLTMMMGNHVKIIIYEGRWFVDNEGKIRWQGKEQGKTRRDQVVTLQDHVIEQMPEYIQRGLFQRVDERVWPTSRNIPIREVEDRLFDLIQPFVQNGQIELIPENLNEQTERLVRGSGKLFRIILDLSFSFSGDFDILVGADGSNSFVRRYCNIQMVSEGLEYACGVAYDIPDNVDLAEEPLHQALNCILTVSQSRYLVNSSASRRGYLYIRLIKDEYDELREHLISISLAEGPLNLLDYNHLPQTPVWTIIRQGLEFFKISPRYVHRVVPIEINVRHASVVVREIRFEIDQNQVQVDQPNRRKYKTKLVFLAGDAAMCVHFWPGRGMNSGMKAAIALARNILRSCTSNNAIHISTPLRFLDFLDYEGFMARLRAREQQGRSLRVLINPIDRCIEEAFTYANLNLCYNRYRRRLVKSLQNTRERFEGHPEWPHNSRPITDEELQYPLNRIMPLAVAQLSLANPWPTREMSGADVQVEDTYPYDSRDFLPIPAAQYVTLNRTLSTVAPYHSLTLWIMRDDQTEDVQNLIADLQRAADLSNNTDHPHQLVKIHTIEEAQQWFQDNQGSVKQRDVIFKVVTEWTMDNNKTAIDVIRAVRSELSWAPVLIFTNQYEGTQAALEFLNVTITSKESEVKEFVGLNQEIQWSPGYSSIHSFIFVSSSSFGSRL